MRLLIASEVIWDTTQSESEDWSLLISHGNYHKPSGIAGEKPLKSYSGSLKYRRKDQPLRKQSFRGL